jgi:hypothetical protein
VEEISVANDRDEVHGFNQLLVMLGKMSKYQLLVIAWQLQKRVKFSLYLVT